MRKAQSPLLEIKISGPGVKPGCIALEVLFKICHEAQEAVNRQAQAIKSKTTGKPITEAAIRECRLELIGLRKGSTVLVFSPASKQPSLLPETELLGVVAVSAVATTLRAVNQRRGKWTAPDPRVLDALEDLGSIFKEGVDKLEWISPASARRKRTTAEFVPSYLPKIKRRKQEALPLGGVVTTTEFSFPVAPPLLPKRESFIKDALEPADARIWSFFSHKTIDELRTEQGVPAVTDLEALSGLIPAEDLEEFVADIYRDREA